MAIHDTQGRPGRASRAFHWLTALLILIVFPLGMIASEWPLATPADAGRRLALFSAHKSLGILILAVTLLRILRALSAPRPRPIASGEGIGAWLGAATRLILWLGLVLVPLTGWFSHAAAGGPAAIWWPFGQGLPFIPQSEAARTVFAGMHDALTTLLLIAVALHVAGALKHWLHTRDLPRAQLPSGRAAMVGPAEAAVAPAPRMPHRTAFAGAVLIVLAVLLAGALAGRPEGPAPPAGGQAQDAGEGQFPLWEVTEGEITFTITRFGAPVSGRFASWDAGIYYSPALGAGRAGHVRAVIDIASLEMGSLTDQALGFDFFDAQSHPRAVFAADILMVMDGQIARGTLRLKGVEREVELLFLLRIEGDRAQADAVITLDRLDFGIGRNLPDDSMLGHDVRVNVNLRARRRSP